MDTKTEISPCKEERTKQNLGIRILCSCRNELYASYPYLDGAFASLGYEASRETDGIETDGIQIFFCPDFLLEKYIQNPAGVRRGYLHMLLHCLYLHPFLEKKEDERLWNLACDMAAEQIIEREKVRCLAPQNEENTKEPGAEKENRIRQDCLSLLGKKGLAAQEIYRKLEQKKFPYKTEEMAQAFYFDDHMIWFRKGKNQGGIRKKWEQLLVYTTRGKEKTKHRIGANKGNQSEELEEISDGRYDYRKFLKQFSFPREEVEIDTESFDYIFYTYGMDHYQNMPLIEPLEYKEVNRLEELVIAIDTSGSCSRETVQRFLEETYSILSARENFFRKMKVYLIQCDCCIQNVALIHSEEEWKEYSKRIRIEGRGGTDFRPVFEYVRQLREKKELKDLKALIYFTDGDGIYPREKPDYETAFVFLKKTENMNLVPVWARQLVCE